MVKEQCFTAEKLIKDFSLEQHLEGGWFSEVYTAGTELGVLPNGRCLVGSIYFLLQGKDISHFHQLDCDEIWYYHAGCGLLMHLVHPDGRYEKKYLGLDNNALPMIVIPQGTIFAAENISTSSYTFISCMTVPKFRYTGFRLIEPSELQELSLPEKLFIDSKKTI